jgi:hypothetical protein
LLTLTRLLRSTVRWLNWVFTQLLTRLGKIVTVADGDATDVYGNVEPTEVETTVRYELQQQRRDEAGDPDNWQIGAWSLYLPSGTAVTGWDRFIDDQNDEYELFGPPERKWNPRAQQFSHVQATVRRVT